MRANVLLVLLCGCHSVPKQHADLPPLPPEITANRAASFEADVQESPEEAITWDANGMLQIPATVSFQLMNTNNRFVVEVWDDRFQHTGRIFWDSNVLGRYITPGPQMWLKVRNARAHELTNTTIWP